MHVVSDKNKNKEQIYIYGYEDNKTEKEKQKKVIQSLLTSLLMHDDIYLTFSDFRQVIDYIGQEDAFLLLSLKCLKILSDQHIEPVISVGEDRFTFSTIHRIGDEIEKFENSLKDSDFSSELQKQKFILCTEDSLIKCDHEKLSQLIPREISSDLKNLNIREQLDINSQSTKDVSKYDIYKLLRVANISKGLIYQSEYNIGATTVDGYASKYLQTKLSHFSKEINSQTGDILLKILSIKGIPDLTELYQKNILTMHDIINIRENFNGKVFRAWYYSIDYNQDQFLFHLTNIKKDGRFKQFSRWLIPNAIGLLSPVAGAAASALDSYIIEKIISGWQPNIFLDDILKEEINKKMVAHNRKIRKEEIIKRFGKVGRNEACPCQSGKKFKKCCGRS